MYLFLLIVVLSSLYVVWRKLKNSSDLKGIKTPPNVSVGIPYLGPAIQFSKDPLHVLQYAKEKYGPVFTINLILYRVTFVTEEKAIKYFFNAHSTELSFDQALDILLAPIVGIWASYDPAIVKLNHTSTRIGFLPKHADKFIPAIRERAQSRMESWAKKDSIHLVSECFKLVALINIEFVFGKEFTDKFGPELTHLLFDFEYFGTSIPNNLFPNCTFIPQVRQFRKVRQRLYEIASGYIKEWKASKSNSENWNYLSFFLGRDVLDQDVQIVTIHMISVLWAAGTSTVGTLVWGLCLMFQNKSVLENVLKAINSLSPGESSSYLKNVMLETTRYVQGALLFRKTTADIQLGEYTIPSGQLVACYPRLFHFDSQHFSEPCEFNPSRDITLPPNGTTPTRTTAAIGKLLSFGSGRHHCHGAYYAQTVVTTCWSVLLKDYNIQFPHGFPRPFFRKFIGTPLIADDEKKLWVSVRSRV